MTLGPSAQARSAIGTSRDLKATQDFYGAALGWKCRNARATVSRPRRWMGYPSRKIVGMAAVWQMAAARSPGSRPVRSADPIVRARNPLDPSSSASGAGPSSVAGALPGRISDSVVSPERLSAEFAAPSRMPRRRRAVPARQRAAPPVLPGRFPSVVWAFVRPCRAAIRVTMAVRQGRTTHPTRSDADLARFGTTWSPRHTASRTGRRLWSWACLFRY